MLLTVGILLGEVVSWYLSSRTFGLALVVAGGLVLFLSRRRFVEVAAGALVGIVLSTPMQFRDSKLVGSEDVSFQGVVRETPRRTIPGQVVFELDAALGQGQSLVRCRAIDLPWRNSALLVAGATVVVRGALKPTLKPINPISWEGWLWRRGVDAECKALFISKPIEFRSDWVTSLRETLRETSLALTDNERGVALLLSMALGYRDVLSPTIERAFSTLGLTHLLVVSGYQVSMVFGCVLVIGMVIAPRGSTFRYWREGLRMVALCLTLAYVVMIGAEMSSVRAFIAATFICSQQICETRSSFAQRWAVALLLMQLVWPYCLFDIGVVLTFAALAGIGTGAAIGGRRKMVTWVAVTCSVWVFTSLIVVLWNGAFSLVSVPMNLFIAAPWSALNCTAGLASLLAAAFGVPGAPYVLSLIAGINSLLSEVLLWIVEFPFAGWILVGVHRIVVAATLSLLGAVLLGCAYRARQMRV